MEKKKVLILPYPSSPILDGTELRNSGGDIYLKIGFDVDEIEKYVTLRFKKVRAYRKRAESHCESWHVKDVMDNVAVVIGSDWVAELRAVTNTQNKNAFEMNHYMIYVDDFGSLEVVAETVAIE
jgi:hypothetical protein